LPDTVAYLGGATVRPGAESPWTPLGASPPDPSYRLALRALAMSPPLPNPKYATGLIDYSNIQYSIPHRLNLPIFYFSNVFVTNALYD